MPWPSHALTAVSAVPSCPRLLRAAGRPLRPFPLLIFNREEELQSTSNCRPYLHAHEGKSVAGCSLLSRSFWLICGLFAFAHDIVLMMLSIASNFTLLVLGIHGQRASPARHRAGTAR